MDDAVHVEVEIVELHGFLRVVSLVGVDHRAREAAEQPSVERRNSHSEQQEPEPRRDRRCSVTESVMVMAVAALDGGGLIRVLGKNETNSQFVSALAALLYLCGVSQGQKCPHGIYTYIY